MAPPNRRRPRVPNQGVNEEQEERPIVLTEAAMRAIFDQFLREGNIVPSNVDINRFISLLNQQSRQAVPHPINRSVEHDEYDITVNRVQIQREGIALRAIIDEFMNSRIRERITILAKHTDLNGLDYTKFCEIMADLRSNRDWETWESLNESVLIQMVFMLTYFKELIYHGLCRGHVTECCSIVWYFIKYINEGNLVSSLSNLIKLGIQKRKLAAGLVILAISSVVALSIYSAFR